MGINDRQYYRDSHSSKRSSVWQLDELTPVVKYLLLSNIAVFLLQIFVVREVHVSPLEMLRKHDPQLDKLLTEVESGDAAAKERLKKRYPHLDKFLSGGEGEDDHFQFPGQRISVVQEWLELDTKKIVNGGQVWRLLTHAFCHERQSVWHIVLNMLCLYWFGCALESMYGPREFLLFYLTAAVIGGVGFVVLDLYTGSNIPGIGASGAVMGVMMLYTMHFPRSLIYILLIIPLEMRWVMLAYVIWDLHPVLLNLAGDRLSPALATVPTWPGWRLAFCITTIIGDLNRRWIRWKRCCGKDVANAGFGSCPKHCRCRRPHLTWTAWTSFWRRSSNPARPASRKRNSTFCKRPASG